MHTPSTGTGGMDGHIGGICTGREYAHGGTHTLLMDTPVHLTSRLLPSTQVIHALAHSEESPKARVPFSDSVLTRILQVCVAYIYMPLDARLLALFHGVCPCHVDSHVSTSGHRTTSVDHPCSHLAWLGLA